MEMEQVPSPQPRLLFVDDEQAILNSVKRLLRPLNWDCEFVTSAKQAVQLLRQEGQRFDVIISDLRMPLHSGQTLLNYVAQYHPSTVRVLLSAYANAQVLSQLINNAGIFRHIEKPWQADQLIEALTQALAHSQQQPQASPVEDEIPNEVEGCFPHYEKVRTSALNSQMFLAKSVYDENDVLLLKQGCQLDDNLISRLQLFQKSQTETLEIEVYRLN